MDAHVCKLFRLLGRIKSILKIKLLQIRLAHGKRNQRVAFNALNNEFSMIYNDLRKHDIARFMTPSWEKNNTDLENEFLPYPEFAFLRNPTIMNTMFVSAGGRWLREELNFLESKVPKERLVALLQEDYVGNPPLSDTQYLTSHNKIHHLFHLVRFMENVECDVDNIRMVVEWGGGYGNMANLFKRLKGVPSTYIIIDTPLFNAIQYVYLTSILGAGGVNLLQRLEDQIQENCINLMPLCFLERQNINADLFISTWALSESSSYSQDWVRNHDWFHAKHLLLAYQDSSDEFPNAERVGKMAADGGAVIENIEFLPGNHYAFR